MSNDDFPSLNSLGSTSPIVPISNGKLSAAQMLSRAHAGTSNETSNGSSTSNGSGDYMVDPFPPSLDDSITSSNGLNDESTSVATPKRSVDISDESAFPSLGGGSKKVGGTTWGSSGGSERVKQLASSAASLAPPSSATSSRSATPSSFDDKPSSNSIYTTTVQIPTLSIQIRSLNSNNTPKPAFKGITPSRGEPEPSTLGEVMKFLMKKSPNVKVEASTSRSITTFIIKSKGINGEQEVERVKRELLARLSKKIEIKVEIPAGLRPFVIGAKGKTLKEITELTGASVQVPNRDETAAPIETSTDSPDGPLISITISGEQSGVALAKAKILAIVNERASKVTSKIAVEQQFWIHLEKSLSSLLAELEVENVEVKVPRNDQVRGILASAGEEKFGGAEKEEEVEKVVVVGDASNVKKVVEAIQASVEELKKNTNTITVSIAKRQHRCLVGKNADHVFETTGCSVELPPVEESDEKVTIRGPQSELVKALGLVMEVSNSEPIETLDLLTAHRGNHDTKAYSSHLTRYLLRKSKFQSLSAQHSVQVYLPRSTAIEAGTPLIEIVGKDSVGLAGARKDVIAIVRALPPAHFWVVQVDALNHRHLYSGKNGKKIKSMEEEKKVEVLFPEEGSDRSDILLVYTGEGAASLALASAIAEIDELAKEAATIKTSTLTIPNKLHKYIQGHNSTTLNAILGEEKLSSVSFGAKGDDKVIIRGPEKDLARVVGEIERMAEEAKDAEVLNSHVIEFEVDTLQVRHVVGKAGSGINKLREELGVQVDFEELPVASTSGGKKAGIARSKVTIKGRKENCLAARKRITTVVDKMADEVTLTIPLPASIERGSIIGKQGTYLIRLETNYDVKINFPKAGKSSNDTTEKNEIVIRGPKKGAEAAKKELVDLMDYEKENGNVVSFVVVSKALPRILGKAGATINGIKEETGVNSIDVDQEEEGPSATITLKGTKSGTTKAKAMILAIAKEVEDEAKLTIEIPREYHTTLIGAGGASIRDLIAKAGGPTDARGSGNAVRFPKQGDSLNTVTIVATKSVAEKIQKALQKELAALESRIVWGVAVAQSAHAGIIGKGASALQELQRKFGVKVVVPGWNEYTSSGEVINPQDVADAPESDIVKILGPKDAAIACAEEISKNRPKSAGPAVTATVMVPRRCHATIAQGGRFFRSLPRGTKVTHDGIKPPASATKVKRPTASSSNAGRIDDEDTGMDSNDGEKIDFQLVALNSEEEDGDIPWVISSTTQADADKTVAEIERALAQAGNSTHVGWVTLPAGFMPRVVGRGGAGLDKLRSAGVEVEVVGRRESNELTLVGTPENIDVAYKMILALAAPRPPRQQRDRDDRDY